MRFLKPDLKDPAFPCFLILPPGLEQCGRRASPACSSGLAWISSGSSRLGFDACLRANPGLGSLQSVYSRTLKSYCFSCFACPHWRNRNREVVTISVLTGDCRFLTVIQKLTLHAHTHSSQILRSHSHFGSGPHGSAEILTQVQILKRPASVLSE